MIENIRRAERRIHQRLGIGEICCIHLGANIAASRDVGFIHLGRVKRLIRHNYQMRSCAGSIAGIQPVVDIDNSPGTVADTPVVPDKESFERSGFDLGFLRSRKSCPKILAAENISALLHRNNLVQNPPKSIVDRDALVAIRSAKKNPVTRRNSANLRKLRNIHLSKIILRRTYRHKRPKQIPCQNCFCPAVTIHKQDVVVEKLCHFFIICNLHTSSPFFLICNKYSLTEDWIISAVKNLFC